MPYPSKKIAVPGSLKRECSGKCIFNQGLPDLFTDKMPYQLKGPIREPVWRCNSRNILLLISYDR